MDTSTAIPADIRTRIIDAAAELYAQSGRQSLPTVDAVRRAARVDMNSASAVMREWRRAQTTQATPVTVQVPEAVQQSSSLALATLWTQAQELANESLRAAQSGWETERAELDSLRQELAHAYESQAGELEAAQALTVEARQSAQDASKGNFSKAIQTYLDTQNGLCAAMPAEAVPFTLENRGVFSKESKKRADALVDAGLLTKRDTEVKAMFGNKMEPATEYQVSDSGKKYLIAKAADTLGRQDAFCTGKFAQVEVDNFTEPSDMMGLKVSHVNFRYKVMGTADWVKAEGLRATYNNFAKQSQGDIQGKTALILTNDGWMHERLFKR